jgi:para-aminobenzoate synthetase / 4-amino-4-deoxychorismate lyase
MRDDASNAWIRFRKLREIVEASCVAEVVAAAARVERLVEQEGLHAAGFIAYEAAPAFDTALRVRPPSGGPLLWFGIFEGVETMPTPEGVVDRAVDPSAVTASDVVSSTVSASPLAVDAWTPSVAPKQYRAAIHRIRDYIRDGDTYQVNYTYRLQAPFGADPGPFFLSLAGVEPPPFAAFVMTEDFAVASASPELFLDLREDRILSRPMKGTAPRGRTIGEDRERAAWLAASEKDRAENLMIVDMVRNDLGRIARTGTVTVEKLFSVEKYPTVWQMTSTVSARTDAGFLDLLRGTFPPASITGAPKARTMEIIAELEDTPRGIYTGALGFLSPGRRMQLNVAIRTAWIDRRSRKATYGVGGGIVWDSRPDLELEEARTKARILCRPQRDFSLLETLRWSPEEGYVLLDRHLARLADSVEYFSFAVDLDDVQAELQRLARGLPPLPHRVRLLVDRRGVAHAEAAVLEGAEVSMPRRACLATAPVDETDPFLYHKTTNRRVYDTAFANASGCNDVILWNARGEVTESCIANIVVEIDGRLVTPPVTCGLLPGTYRAQMLADGRVREEVVTMNALLASPRILLVNSVRGSVPARIARRDIASRHHA